MAYPIIFASHVGLASLSSTKPVILHALEKLFERGTHDQIVATSASHPHRLSSSARAKGRRRLPPVAVLTRSRRLIRSGL